MRSATIREPRWTPQDRAEALALSEYRLSRCPGGCGHPVDESTSHYERGPEYDARSTTCRACAARDEAQRAHADRHPEATARLWYVIKTPRVR